MKESKGLNLKQGNGKENGWLTIIRHVGRVSWLPISLHYGFTNSRVIEDSCGRIARVNVACRVTIRPHLLFLGNGTSRPGRVTEPCKHSIIIVVRENTGLSSGSRLVDSSARRRVALKIMTACVLRFLFSSFPPALSLFPTFVFSIPKLLFPRFFFVTLTLCGKSSFLG